MKDYPQSMGRDGKPSSPAHAVADKIREMTAIEGAMIELTQLARGLEARIKQLESRALQLAAEVEKMRKGPSFLLTNHMPPSPPLS